MKGFRIPQIEGVRLAVPAPVNIGELLNSKSLDSPLLHFTSEQWKWTLSSLKEMDKMPRDAVRIIAYDIPGGFGVVANPFFRCPPGCTPTHGRGEVCPGVVPEGYTPHPDCWFEPQCFCDGEIEVPGGVQPVEDCGNEHCEFRFVPLKIDTGRREIVVARFTCVQTGGDCDRCVLTVTRQDYVFQIGCLCEC